MKILRNSNGAYMSWDCSQLLLNVIENKEQHQQKQMMIEYSVYLLVNESMTTKYNNDDIMSSITTTMMATPQQLPFICVYRGEMCLCLIKNELLNVAYMNHHQSSLDNMKTSIFLITATVNGGYGVGSTTQVRWLQGKYFLFTFFY